MPQVMCVCENAQTKINVGVKTIRPVLRLENAQKNNAQKNKINNLPKNCKRVTFVMNSGGRNNTISY